MTLGYEEYLHSYLKMSMRIDDTRNKRLLTSKAFHITEVFRPLNNLERQNAPTEIFLLGDNSLLKKSVRVALIGTREPTSEGVNRARKLAAKLVERNITVVSGLAQGIDTASHKTAIESGGRTIAVIGTPLSTYYPKENSVLQDEIAQKHLLISQFPESSPISRSNFPIRNRLMALISNATVIIEAKDGSGTRHQALEALRLVRPLWILQSCYEDTSLSWPKHFVKLGANVLSDTSLEEFFEMISTNNSGEKN